MNPVARPPITRADHWLSVSAALISWWWLYPQVLSGLHWHDTSEFIAAGRTLAVAHPPGHPLALIGIHLSQLLPWFDAAERGHLSSSFWGGMGTLCTYYAFLCLVPPRQSPIIIRLVAIFGALCSVALPLVTLQLIRAEVYASQWALTTLVWASLFYAHRQEDCRAYLVAALSLGLLSANHTLLTAALGLSLLPRLLTFGLSLRVWILSLSSYLFGLSLYLYLWMRGQAGGVSGWGWISDLSSFWEAVSAKVWQTQVQQRASEVDFADNLIRFSAFCIGQIGPTTSFIILVTISLGVVRWAKYSPITSMLSTHNKKDSRERIDASWGPTLALATLFITLTKITYPFSTANPDFSGYLAAAVPSALFLLYLSTREMPRSASPMVLFLLLMSALSHSQDSRPPQSRGAAQWGRAFSAETPPMGTLWTSYYATHFISVGLLVTEGWRSDLNLVFRGHRHLPWSHKRLESHERPRRLKSPHTIKALMTAGSRYEVERSLDSTPTLWPYLSWPGSQQGLFTSRLVRFPTVEPPLNLTRQTKIQLKLADARLKLYGDHELIIDEDSAYSWALQHEMLTRWLPSLDQKSPSKEAKALIKAHIAQRDHWLKIIAEENWRSLDLSHSAP